MISHGINQLHTTVIRSDNCDLQCMHPNVMEYNGSAEILPLVVSNNQWLNRRFIT